MKTFSIYWVLASSILVWFLFVHAPPFLLRRIHSSSQSIDIPFALHLLGSYSISLACIVNSLITPSSFGGNATSYHTTIGKVGMIGGMVGFVFGAYCSWWPWRTNLPPRSFSIAITIGGIGQVYLQYKGYVSIQKYRVLKNRISVAKQSLTKNRSPIAITATASSDKTSNNDANNKNDIVTDQQTEDIQELECRKHRELKNHIYSMILLFVVPCGAPALIRLIELFVPENMGDAASTMIVITAIFSEQILANYYTKSIIASLSSTLQQRQQQQESGMHFQLLSSTNVNENTNLVK